MHPEPNLKGLKTLVVSMGILLVVGFLITIAGAWMKFKAASASISNACKDVTVDLKNRGKLVDKTLSGERLILTFKSPEGGLEIIHVDTCSGKQLNSLKILTDA